jgi:hypothetical protein
MAVISLKPLAEYMKRYIAVKRRIKEISKSENEYNFLIRLLNDKKLDGIIDSIFDSEGDTIWEDSEFLRAANDLLNSDEFKFDGDAQSYLMTFIKDVESSIKQQEWERNNRILY